jgi:uncharacterized membrane-anchored protein YhcB (DUF1043 family)
MFERRTAMNFFEDTTKLLYAGVAVVIVLIIGYVVITQTNKSKEKANVK